MNHSRLRIAALFILWPFLFVQTSNAQINGELESNNLGNGPKFRTLVLNEQFHSEGAAVADINSDGHHDVVSGPFWYAGPDFRQRHAYAAHKSYTTKAYSDHFFSFTYDFNQDNRPDILSIPIPGGEGVWYENPGNSQNSIWKKHSALPAVDNESPTFADITGDGRPELICIHQGDFGYASFDPNKPTAAWKFTRVSRDQKLGRFTHGLGVGDINGDGRIDLLETRGWWQQGSSPQEPFEFHAKRFAASGGSQMFAYDFDGDGDSDVLSVDNAHAYGLCWFERRGRDDNDFLFVKHTILNQQPNSETGNLVLSQMHAVGLADMDGDGIKDIVTGKRYFAHGGNDPDAFRLPVLVWLKTTRTADGVQFVPQVIHNRSGVGTQIQIMDIDDNGHNDVIVGNKLGTFVTLNLGKESDAVFKTPPTESIIGSDAFKLSVRETEPLDAEAERLSFVLPDGFQAQLVACEPQIAKPMNLAFDARGRLWVSSSSEYPYPAPADRKGRDTIKILEDTDGDGRADKVTTFADGLNIPIGLYPYQDGVICFSIPNILFLRDTDGDMKADRREVLFGPMDTSRDTHGMCNAFTRGFDGWLHACHGFNNQTTVAGSDGNEVVMHSGNTFRMRMDGSRIEHFTHGQVNPFGMNFTPDGDLFTADCHTKPITLLMQHGYYDSFGKPHDGNGYVPEVMEHLHGSTGIGGIAFYHDDKFPPVFRGNAFAGNVMTSRVNRNRIDHIGSSVRAYEEPDFMVSSDPWFRPVDLQMGPDGALYIADFYNRIIGHYEVALDHPGRDRNRGRIWRIVYTGNDNRRDVNKTDLVTPSRLAASEPTMDQLVTRLSSVNLTQRMSAVDALVDRFGNKAQRAVANLLESSSPDAVISASWVLQRLGVLKPKQLRDLLTHEQTNVRVHAFKILAAQDSRTEGYTDLIKRGFADPQPLVQRSAAMASMQRPASELIKPMLRLFNATPHGDVHLRHALRISLSRHLKNQEWFHETTSDLSGEDHRVIVDLCLAIQTDFAGKFLIENLTSLQDSTPDQLAKYMAFGARFATSEHLGAIAKVSQSRFADDLAYQETLLRSVDDGIRHRGEKTQDSQAQTVIADWATKLAANHFGIDPADPNSLPPRDSSPIAWHYVSHPDGASSDNCWVTSTKRNSADGQKNSQLHSSFPKGESRTGIYRSGEFELPHDFNFYLAGHDGRPDVELQRKNLVRIRDAKTKEVLKQWSPPRNDTAKHLRWDKTSQTTGQGQKGTKRGTKRRDKKGTKRGDKKGQASS